MSREAAASADPGATADDAGIAALLADLEGRIAVAGSAVVAFSGGVDSSLVAAAAARARGPAALAVTAVSPSVAAGELDGARRRAARRRGYATLLSGANADDAGDWRPGLRAAGEHGVRHPLLEAGAGKAEVRALARALGIPSADKPASPCLASRIPYGTAVDPDTLARIDRAERAVRELGFPVLRVRHHGILGRIEVAAEDLDRALDREAEIAAVVRAAGYAHAVVDREPFRSGRLNAVLSRPGPAGRLAAGRPPGGVSSGA